MISRGSTTVHPLLDVTPAEELARVMAEVAGAVHGSGTALTIHPPGRPAEIVHLSGTAELPEIVMRLIETGALDYDQEHPDHHVWLPGEYDGYAPEAIVLPVRQVAGHSRLMITVFFDTLETERRSAAEAAYLARRPFAVGYFRLWQQERLRCREIEASHLALNRVGTAVMLITKAGDLAFANTAARLLLDGGSGITEHHGRLHAQHRADSIALETAIEHVLSASDGGVAPEKLPILRLRRGNSAPLVAAVLPAPSPVTEEGEVAALVFVVDPDMDIGNLAFPICRAFALTRAETEFTIELASGRSVTEAAANLHIKDSTARSYLKSIFLKTGTNRQADLVRMILVSLVRVLENREGGAA